VLPANGEQQNFYSPDLNTSVVRLQEQMAALPVALREKLTSLPVQVGYPHPYHDPNTNLGVLALMGIAEYLERNLYTNEKYTKSKRLACYGRGFYSMGGEDGIIREICRRIGIEKGYFVEFGVDYHGLQNNTLYLLLKGWRGTWVEAAHAIKDAAATTFKSQIDSGALTLINDRVSSENVNQHLANVPAEVDVMSIDIDGQDYWVWKAIRDVRPKVVVVEFNAVLGDEVSCVMPLKPDHAWEGSYYTGASLRALEKLGREKGYSLVGCDYSGVNSFFVRNDLVGDKFETPFTTENHFEPLRVYLTRGGGSLLGFGRFEQV
jgi:hypothetical protein